MEFAPWLQTHPQPSDTLPFIYMYLHPFRKEVNIGMINFKNQNV